METYYLAHHGVKGMKWGVRKKRYSQSARARRDLEALNNGQHLSRGLTKKRQAAYDARDRAALEKRIAKNEARAQNDPQARKKRAKKVAAIGGSVAAAGLAVYGAYKLSSIMGGNKGTSVPLLTGQTNSTARRLYDAPVHWIASDQWTVKS